MMLEKDTINAVSKQSPSPSSEADREYVSTPVNEDIERRVIRKLDFRMVPVLWVLCMY